MPSSHARSETACAARPRASTAPNSSDREEDGLTLALQAHVEAVAVLAGLHDQRPAARLGHALEHRVTAVVLVGEVDPGDAAVEHPAGEHVDVDVRRLAVADAAGLEREDLPRALGVGRGAAEAAEVRAEPAVGVGLPGLDHAVGDDLAVAVEEPSEDADASRRAV